MDQSLGSGRAQTSDRTLQHKLVGAVHRLYNGRHGCGPSEVRFQFDSHGRLVVAMSDLLTPEERERLDSGAIDDRVRNQLLFVRHADPELIEVIEGITGRDVRAVATTLEPEADIATQVFELRPAEARELRNQGSHRL